MGEEVLALYEEALASVPDEPSPVRARLLSAIAVELQWGGDIDRRRRAASEAVAMARAIGDGPTLNVVTGHGLGRPRRATALRGGVVEIQQEALAAAEREHDPEGLVDAQIHLIGTLASARRGGRRPVPPRRGRADRRRAPPAPRSLAHPQPAGHVRRPRRGPRPGRAVHDGGHRGRSDLRPDRVDDHGVAGALLFATETARADRRAGPRDGGPGPDPARGADLASWRWPVP